MSRYINQDRHKKTRKGIVGNILEGSSYERNSETPNFLIFYNPDSARWRNSGTRKSKNSFSNQIEKLKRPI
jgi:hypothetical protein